MKEVAAGQSVTGAGAPFCVDPDHREYPCRRLLLFAMEDFMAISLNGLDALNTSRFLAASGCLILLS
jgi:hypothetical protein